MNGNIGNEWIGKIAWASFEAILAAPIFLIALTLGISGAFLIYLAILCDQLWERVTS